MIIWHEVRGRSLFGDENFVDELVYHLGKNKDVPAIPRSQCYVDRPALDKIISERIKKDITMRNKALIKAVENYGYRQREIADYLGMHFTSISRIVNTKSVL